MLSSGNGHNTPIDYTLDPAGNITHEAWSGGLSLTRDFAYGRVGAPDQLASATTAGVTTNNFYDDRDNLACATTSAWMGGTSTFDCPSPDPTSGAPAPSLQASYSYDDFSQLLAAHTYSSSGTTATLTDSATYTYDALGRPVKEDETHPGTTGFSPRTTLLTYLGLGNRLASETQQDTTSGSVQRSKGYTYDAFGQRVGLTNSPTTPSASDPAGTFSYGRDVHGSISLLLNSAGSAQAAYGYRPYGDKDAQITTGDTDGLTPLNAYRYTNKRLDAGSGTLDMGARRFSPSIQRFLQVDQFAGALANLRLGLDPLTNNRYSLAAGNPISFVEIDGHEDGVDDEQELEDEQELTQGETPLSGSALPGMGGTSGGAAEPLGLGGEMELRTVPQGATVVPITEVKNYFPESVTNPQPALPPPAETPLLPANAGPSQEAPPSAVPSPLELGQERAAQELASPTGSRVPTVTAAAVDRVTGAYATDVSRIRAGLELPAESDINPALRAQMPTQSREPWPVSNCGEFNACNTLLNQGSKLENIDLVAINTRTGEIMTPCDNCQLSLAGATDVGTGMVLPYR